MHEQPITEIVTSYLIHLIMTDIEVYAMRLFGTSERDEEIWWEWKIREERARSIVKRDAKNKERRANNNNWIWKRSTGRKIRIATKSVMHHCANTHRTEMIPRWRPAKWEWEWGRQGASEWLSDWVKKNRHHSIASERECRMKEKLMKCLQFGSCVYVIWILPMRINFDFFLFRSFFTLIFAQWSLLVGTTCVSCASPLIIMIAVGGGGVFVVDFLPFYLQRFDLVL